MRTQAFYADGKTSRLTKLEIEILPHGISIFNFESLKNNVLLYEDIKQFEDQKTQYIIYIGDSAPFQTITIKDPEAKVLFDRYTAHLNNVNDTHRKIEKIGPIAYVGGLAAVIALLALFYLIIIPAAKTGIVSSIPISYEIELGQNAAKTIIETQNFDSSKTNLLNQFLTELNLKSKYPLHINYLSEKTVNAYALPGGEIFVYQGIIDKMDNYEELVALIGHETGHVTNRHGLKNQINALSSFIVIQLFTGASDEFFQSILTNASNLRLLSYSREAEREADIYGFETMKITHTDPKGMVNLFEKLKGDHDHNQKLLDFISTHPNIDERIANAEQQAQRVNFTFHQNKKLEGIFHQLQSK